MKLFLACTALAVLLGACAVWLAAGRNLKKQKDPMSLLKRLVPLAAALVILALDAWGIAFMLPREKEPLTIQACEEASAIDPASRIYFIDITADGVKLSKKAQPSGQWIQQELGYRLDTGRLTEETGLYDVLNLMVPVGTNRCLIMEASMNSPMILVTCGDYQAVFPSRSNQGSEISLPIPDSDGAALIRLWKRQLMGYAAALLLFDGLFVLLCRRLMKRREKQLPAARRNGAMELYRFLASIIIVLYHTQMQLGLKTHICVEFFMVVSGWFMMAHFDKKAAIGKADPWSYMKGRMARILPTFVLIWTVAALFQASQLGRTMVQQIQEHTMELLMLQGLGFDVNSNVIQTDWFLQAIMPASLIMYTALCIDREKCNRYLFPIFGLAVTGWLVKTYGTLNLSTQTADTGLVLTVGTWRAMAELGLGCSLFDWTKTTGPCAGNREKAWTAVLEMAVLSALMVIMFTWRRQLDGIGLLLVLLLIVLVMRKQSFLTEALSSPVTEYLGSISLSIYLWHQPVLDWLGIHLPGTAFVPRFMMAAAITLVLSAATAPVVRLLTGLAGKAAGKLRAFSQF